MFSTVLLIAFAVITAVNCVFYIIFSKFSFSQPFSPARKNSIPISLIVCSKNESENLKKHIPLWLKQNYPNFEIILVNDASRDDTLDVIESFSEIDPRIKIVNVVNNEAFWANKKYALTLGIKKAKNNHLLFTDADCKPNSDQWIQEMADQFSEKKSLILGYGAYQKQPSFLNKIIRFETCITAIQYFSYAKIGIPYMGVGRNLGYTSSLFYENNGFMSHMYIRSGDDDLFVNEVATKENTALCFSAESFTESIPKNSWKEFWNQKKRHITTAKHYKTSHKLLLVLHYAANILFWIGVLTCFFFIRWEWLAGLIAFRICMQYLSLTKGIKKLGETGLLALIPLLEVFLISFQLSIFISNIFSKPKHWK
ncbi:MAG: glycosyltransferase [Flavobacteriales bacterium]|nr:glycosyltransferase [Flavobacteriales bacterium]